MKVSKKELKVALDKVSLFTDVTEYLDTKRIGVQKKDGKLTLFATSLTSAGCASFVCEDGDDVSFQVPRRCLLNATYLPVDDVEFVIDGNSLVVQGENTVLNAEATEEFKLDSYNEIFVGIDSPVEIQTGLIKKAIKNGSFARNESDTSRAFIQGAFVSLKDGKLTVRSTDAKRLATCTIDVASEVEFSGTINTRCIKAIEMASGDTVGLFIDEKRMLLVSDSLTACLPIIECEYPDTDRFFSAEQLKKVVIAASSMNKSLTMITAISDDGILNVSCKGDKLTIGFGNDCKSKTDISVENADASEFEFFIDAPLLSDVFKKLGAEKIEVGFTGASKPIEYDDKDGSRGVVMPLRK